MLGYAASSVHQAVVLSQFSVQIIVESTTIVNHVFISTITTFSNIEGK